MECRMMNAECRMMNGRGEPRAGSSVRHSTLSVRHSEFVALQPSEVRIVGGASLPRVAGVAFPTKPTASENGTLTDSSPARAVHSAQGCRSAEPISARSGALAAGSPKPLRARPSASALAGDGHPSLTPQADSRPGAARLRATAQQAGRGLAGGPQARKPLVHFDRATLAVLPSTGSVAAASRQAMWVWHPRIPSSNSGVPRANSFARVLCCSFAWRVPLG